MSQILQRRKPRLVIEKDFQYRFTLKICLVNGFLICLFTGIFLFFININYDMLINGALKQLPQTVAQLRGEFRFMVALMLAALLILILLLFISGLYLTQQIAGPLFSLKSRLKEFADGKNKVRMNLRSSDEFHNLEELFNYAMERHEERRQDLQESLEKFLTKNMIQLKEAHLDKELTKIIEEKIIL
jgi:methyl-accepting chemotaxis protein